MTVEQYLRDKGFTYKVQQNRSGKQALMECPACRDKHSFSINLDNGAYNCFRQNKCGIKGSFTDFQRMFNDVPQYLDNDSFIKNAKKYNLPDAKKVKPVNNEVIKYLTSRGITEKTVKKFRLAYLENAIVFPFIKNSKVVNFKYRSITEKKFWKEKNAMPCLYNQDNITNDTLIITEGEIDAMSFSEWGYEAVSIPSGVSDMTWIENDWEYLEKFKTIYLVMDNDIAGQSIIEQLAFRLGKWRCRNVLLPYKDANECLQKGITKSDIEEILEESASFELAELKNCSYFTSEIIEYKNNPKKLDGIVTGNEELTKIMHGWRDEELSIWTGQNSSGKSTYLSQEALHLIKERKRVCVGSFEMKPKKFLWWMLKQYSEKDFASDVEVTNYLKDLSENLFIIDILGEIDKDKLFEVMEFGYRKYGINVFILDSLMKINLTSDSQKIYGEQKKLVSKLKDFAEMSASHIHLVAHPRKQDRDEVIIGKSDVAGTGDITNLADNVFILHRYTENQKESRRNQGKDDYDAILIVKKNREAGETGQIALYFNPKTKRYSVEKYDKELSPTSQEPINSFYEKEKELPF